MSRVRRLFSVNVECLELKRLKQPVVGITFMQNLKVELPGSRGLLEYS